MAVYIPALATAWPKIAGSWQGLIVVEPKSVILRSFFVVVREDKEPALPSEGYVYE